MNNNLLLVKRTLLVSMSIVILYLPFIVIYTGFNFFEIIKKIIFLYFLWFFLILFIFLIMRERLSSFYFFIFDDNGMGDTDYHLDVNKKDDHKGANIDIKLDGEEKVNLNSSDKEIKMKDKDFKKSKGFNFVEDKDPLVADISNTNSEVVAKAVSTMLNKDSENGKTNI